MNPAYKFIQQYRNIADLDAAEEYLRLMIDPKDGSLHVIQAHETYHGRLIDGGELYQLHKDGLTDSPHRGASIVDRVVTKGEALRWLCETFLPDEVTIKSTTATTVTIGLKTA
jgi:hypothetical protein